MHAYNEIACPRRFLMNVFVIFEIAPLLLMGLALGMDVFSVSLGIGMQPISFRRIVWIGFVFGFFHMIMLLCGIVFGHVFIQEIHVIANLIGGLLLIGLGTHMIFSTMVKDNPPSTVPFGIGVFILALTVSIDSFTVGFSIGIVGMKVVGMLLFVGLISMMLAWMGMVIGKKVSRYLGVYSEILGGSILIALGLHIVFS